MGSTPSGDGPLCDTNAELIDTINAPLGAADTNDNNQADPYAVNLAQGATVLTADSGYFAASRDDDGVLGNQVRVESDYDGLFAPANGDDFDQPGVTVDFYRNGAYSGYDHHRPYRRALLRSRTRRR
ncbi:MAG: hypothetical protein GXP37_14970 [Chloroflexi bacterium]|nr:hypothetical protein [Chloroflexota bacterium]